MSDGCQTNALMKVFNEDFMLLIEFVFGYIFRYSGSDKKNKYQRVDETI